MPDTIEPNEPAAAEVSAVREPQESRAERNARWLAVFTALLLSFAAVGAAWTGYEVARWSGVQATEFSNANGARQESVRTNSTAGQLVQIDVASFFQAVNAFAVEDEELFDFYRDRMREEFQPVFDEWLAFDPANNLDAPLSPFDLPSYSVAELAEAMQFAELAEEATQLARDANETQNQYTVAIVFFAAALFFAGISTSFTSMRSRVSMVAVGTLLFVAVTIWVGALPKSVSL